MSDFIQPGQCQIKDPSILVGLMERRFSPLLVTIIKYVVTKYGLVMTESYRAKTHRNDLHGTQPVRAIDLRTWCYLKDTARQIAFDINTRWQYDPQRQNMKCAIIHDNRKGGGQHFHIQVHPNTQLRGHV